MICFMQAEVLSRYNPSICYNIGYYDTMIGSYKFEPGLIEVTGYFYDIFFFTLIYYMLQPYAGLNNIKYIIKGYIHESSPIQ